MSKELMMQCLYEMDKLFYQVIDAKITDKAKAEEQWDFCFEKLEKMIKAEED